MANGDISNVIILNNGFQVTCNIAGLSTGGVYNFGLGNNNNPLSGIPTVVFTVISMGFDDNGNPTTIKRFVYGTAPVRNPYSLNGQQFTKAESGNSPVTITFALNEPIYQNDNIGVGKSGTAPTVSFISGFYTENGISSNQILELNVTNNSTLAYPKVVANWSRPTNDKVGGTIMPGVVAFHKFAQNGRPIRCIKITAADAHSNSVTTTILNPIVDTSYGDAIPVVEYCPILDISNFTQGDLGTLDFKAYPWIGDSTSIIDTTTGVSGNSPLYGTRNFICDISGTYSQAVIYVDNSGNDITGDGTLANPYLTIAKAITSVQIYNVNNYARASCDGGIIYLGPNGGTQTFSWLGSAAPTYGATPMKCNLIISSAPGQSSTNISLGAYSTAKWTGLMIKIQNLTINMGNGAGTGCFDPNVSNASTWFHNCIINSTTSPIVYRSTVWHMTICNFTALAQGIFPFSTVNTSPSIIRGNKFPATSGYGSLYAYTFIGNSKTTTYPSLLYVDNISGSLTPKHTNTIIAFNKWTAGGNTSAIIALRAGINEINGLAVVQNIFEQTSGTNPVIQIAADGSTVYGPINNVIIHHNVFIGQRCNICYDENGADSGTNAGVRTNWSVKNNIIDQVNIKTDTFTGNSCVASISGLTVTVTQSGHQFQVGDIAYISGFTGASSAYNGAWTVATITGTYPTSTTFTYIVNSNVGATTGSPALGPHPNRINNWQNVYGVGFSGNCFAETLNIGVAGTFQQDFSGINTIRPTVNLTNQIPTSQPPSCTPNTLSFISFKNRKSFNGTISGSGNGDYSINSISPAFNIQYDFILPYDINGNPRSAQDAAGAYATLVHNPLLSM